MSTGYTSAIKDGISFEDFALHCARAFGALISLRDDPHDTPIPDEIKPSDFYKEQLEEAEEELNKLIDITEAEADETAVREYEAEVQSNKDRINEKNQLKLKYTSMLKEVNNWNPPTSDHEELKSFMQRQITASIEWDCDTSYYEEYTPTKQIGVEWLASYKKRLEQDIKRYTKKYAEEVERCAGRTEWVQALKKSL